MKFIDTAIIEATAGNGGKGHCSFRREKYVPKGGPDGGNGGNGGNVIMKADAHLTTLLDFHYRRHFQAQHGNSGDKSLRTGRSGNDLLVRVPVGTVVRNADTRELIGDFTADQQTLIIAHGGRGGRGNAEFKTSVNQAPRYAEPGTSGEECRIELELKILADVGIVGFPNAGKSTLISVISAAKPKIADYPFTTLVPNLGIVRIGDEKSFSVADIPGLIEGAHRGKGLGIQFLRHIERTRLLVFMIDSTSDDPMQDYATLCSELTKYRRSLARKRRIIVLSKTDVIDDEKRQLLQTLDFNIADAPKAILLSAVAGEGVETLKHAMWNLLQLPDVEEYVADDDDDEFEEERIEIEEEYNKENDEEYDDELSKEFD